METKKTVLFIFFLITIFTYTGFSQKFSVQRTNSVFVKFSINPHKYRGKFPVNVQYIGKISMKKTGIVKYLYEYANGRLGKPKTVVFKKPGTQTVAISMHFNAPETGKVRIRILSPVQVNSNWARYELNYQMIMVKKEVVKPQYKQKKNLNLEEAILIKKLGILIVKKEQLIEEIKKLEKQIKTWEILIGTINEDINKLNDDIKNAIDRCNTLDMLQQFEDTLQKIQANSINELTGNTDNSSEDDSQQLAKELAAWVYRIEQKIEEKENLINIIQKTINQLKLKLKTKKSALVKIIKEIRLLKVKLGIPLNIQLKKKMIPELLYPAD